MPGRRASVVPGPAGALPTDAGEPTGREGVLPAGAGKLPAGPGTSPLDADDLAAAAGTMARAAGTPSTPGPPLDYNSLIRPHHLLAAPLLVAVATASSCSAPSKGALILALSTDMQTPKDVSVVSVYIETNGVPKLDLLGRVRPDGSIAFPSTLAVVEPDAPGAQVHIRVVAFQETKARVVRDVLTTVPHQQVGMLRLPISFLDDGSATGSLPMADLPIGPANPSGAPEALSGTGGTQFQPTNPDPTYAGFLKTTCDFSKSQTSFAGSCTDAKVPSAKLAAYSDPAVFGDGGTPDKPVCFPVAQCFARAQSMPIANITPAADGSCSFPIMPTEKGKNWNCALATTDGTGAAANGMTLVPLGSDPGEGFSVQPGKVVVMVPGVCKRLMAGSASLLLDKSSCPTKVESMPVCQESQGGAPVVDAGVPAADASEASDGSAAPDVIQPGGDASATADGQVSAADASSDAADAAVH